MNFEIKDPYVKYLNMSFEGKDDKSVSFRATMKKYHYNFVEIPHGGYMGAVAVAAAELAAEILLGCEMRVDSMSMLFADVCKTKSLVAKAILLSRTDKMVSMQVELSDEDGLLITSHEMTLVDKDTTNVDRPLKQTVFPAESGERVIKYLNKPLPYDMNMYFFEKSNHMFMTKLEGNIEEHVVELYDDIKDRYGYYHNGVLYAMLDASINGYMVENNMNSRTLMSSIQSIKQAAFGPCYCETEVLRFGKSLVLCQCHIKCNEEIVAIGQFILNNRKPTKESIEFFYKMKSTYESK